MGLKSDQHTCSLPTCPSLNCSFYFSPHLRKQDARFFFSLSPLCTFQRWARRTATIERSKPPPLPRRRSSVEWMAVFEAPSWALAKRWKKGRKNLSFWACPPRHFILCQGSTRFTGQTLDRGHLLAFLHLRARPDVNVQPPPAPPPKKHNRPRLPNASAVGNAHPPLLSTLPPPSASPPCVLENSQNHRLLYLHPTAPSFIIILRSLHERRSFSRPAVITVIHVYDSRHCNASIAGYFSSDKWNWAPQASVQMKCKKTVSHFVGGKKHEVN